MRRICLLSLIDQHLALRHMNYFLILVALSAAPAEDAYVIHLSRESGARREVRLWDGTRVDLVGPDWVGEVDFARKWAEGVGQATYYSETTGKHGRLYLIYAPGEERFVYRAIIAGRRADIDVIPVRSSTISGHPAADVERD